MQLYYITDTTLPLVYYSLMIAYTATFVLLFLLSLVLLRHVPQVGISQKLFKVVVCHIWRREMKATLLLLEMEQYLYSTNYGNNGKAIVE